MTIQEGPDGFKEKAVRKDWPVVEGITAGTTKQRTASPFLEAEEGSVVNEKDKVGF